MNLDLDFADDVIDILNYIGEKFGIAIDWSAKTVLPYLQQLGQKYIAYKISISWFWIFFSIGLVILGLLAWLIIDRFYDGEGWGFFIFCCAVIVAVIVACINAYTIIECKTFPEKVLFEYVKSLYNSGISGR